MKKILMSLFVLGLFAFSFQAHASVLSDALLKIENLTKELTQLKLQLKASVADTSSVPVINPLSPKVTVVATPSSIAKGGSSTITWTSANALYCNLSGGSIAGTAIENKAGVKTGPLTTSTSYNVTCTGRNGLKSSDNAVVYVEKDPVPIVAPVEPSCPSNYPNPWALCKDGKIEPATKDAKGCTTSYKCVNPVVPTTPKITVISKNESTKIKEGGESDSIMRFYVSHNQPESINVNSFKINFEYVGGDSTRLDNYIKDVRVYTASARAAILNVSDFAKEKTGVYSKTVSIPSDRNIVFPKGNREFYVTVTTNPSIPDSTSNSSKNWNIYINNIRYTLSSGFVSTDNSVVKSNFSIISPNTATPSITVLSPNGGESYKAGDKISVKWKTENISANHQVNLVLVGYRSNGTMGMYTLLSQEKILNDGSEIVTLPKIPTYAGIDFGKNFKVEITDNGEGNSDISDGLFTINSASKTTNLPDLTITDFYWTPENPIASSSVITDFRFFVTIKNIGTDSIVLPPEMRISVYKDDSFAAGIALGTAYYLLKPGDSKKFEIKTTQEPVFLKNSGTFTLTAWVDNNETAEMHSNEGLVKESNENNNFLIKKITIKNSTTTPSITVLSPNGGESWTIGNEYEVTWKAKNYDSQVNIALALPYTSNGGQGYSYCTIGSTPASAERFKFILSEYVVNSSCNFVGGKVIPGQYKVSVYSGYISDQSDNYFTINSSTTITPSITVTSSNESVIIDNATEKGVLRFNIKAENSDVNINSFKIIFENKNKGISSSRLSDYITEVNTYRDGIQIGALKVSDLKMINSGLYSNTLPIALGVSSILNSQSKDYYIKVKMNPSFSADNINNNWKVSVTSIRYTDSTGFVRTSDASAINTFSINSATTTTPSITVLSPNGGETYTAGQQITVKWKTENFSSSYNVAIQLMDDVSKINYKDNGRQLFTINDGEALFTIPLDDWDGTKLIGGKRYKIGIWSGMNEGYPNLSSDWSDSTFTINSSATKNDPVISGISGPQTLDVNQKGTWKVTASSPTGGNLSYSVKWGDEVYLLSTTSTSQSSISAQQLATFTHTYSQAGTYTPTFTVTSENTIRCITTPCPSNGGSAKTSLSVKVGNSTINCPVELVDCAPGFGPESYLGDNGCIKARCVPITTKICPVGCTCYDNGLITCPANTSSAISSNNTSASNTTTSSQPNRTLKVGVKGDDVKVLQTLLGIEADGSFGPMTKAKVMEWQRTNGLTADGAFGNASRLKAGL